MKLLSKIMVIICFILALTPIVESRLYEEPANISGFQDLLQWNDRVLDNNSGIGYLLLVFFVSFVLLKGFESAQAFTGCLYLTMITAFGCWALGILNSTYMISSIVLCALTALLIMWFSG